MKNLVFFIFVMFMFQVSSAQETESPSKNHHVGFHVGSTTGVGVSYRYWPKRWGIQVTGTPFFRRGDRYIIGGLSAMYKIVDGNRVDFFGYLGNEIIHQSVKLWVYDSATGGSKQQRFRDNVFNIGLGLGLKFDIGKAINLNIQGGWAVYDAFGEIYDWEYDPTWTYACAEIGVYYNF